MDNDIAASAGKRFEYYRRNSNDVAQFWRGHADQTRAKKFVTGTEKPAASSDRIKTGQLEPGQGAAYDSHERTDVNVITKDKSGCAVEAGVNGNVVSDPHEMWASNFNIGTDKYILAAGNKPRAVIFRRIQFVRFWVSGTHQTANLRQMSEWNLALRMELAAFFAFLGNAPSLATTPQRSTTSTRAGTRNFL